MWLKCTSHLNLECISLQITPVLGLLSAGQTVPGQGTLEWNCCLKTVSAIIQTAQLQAPSHESLFKVVPILQYSLFFHHAQMEDNFHINWLSIYTSVLNLLLHKGIKCRRASAKDRRCIPVLNNPVLLSIYIFSLKAIAYNQNTMIQIFTATVWLIINT